MEAMATNAIKPLFVEMGNQDIETWFWETGLTMYSMDSKGGAIVCMLLSLFFLGTWPVVIALLERRGRLPQHTFLDFAISNLLAAVIMVFMAGQLGYTNSGMPNFLNQLSQMRENWPSVLFALAGGVILSIGNLSAQYAWALVGLSVVEVVSSSISVTIGTTVNYFLDGRMNNAVYLFAGVGCFLVAVFLGSAVHKSDAADKIEKLKCLPTRNQAAGYTDDMKKMNFPEIDKDISGYKETSMSQDKQNIDIEKANQTNRKPQSEIGTADFLVQLEEKRSIKVFGRSSWLGLAATFLAGLCFALFSPLFNLATNDQFHLLRKGVPHLVVYTAFFYFTVSWFVMAILLNVSFLYRPILGLPKSSLNSYRKDSDGRGWALLAGLLCGFGNGLQFIGGQAAGYATAGSVQAFPLVTALWGMLVFGEYRRSSRRTSILLVSMLLTFIIAVCLFLASCRRRKL